MPAAQNLGLNLAMAMVASSDTPLLLLDGDLIVVAVSDSFCDTFDVRQKQAVGVSIFVLGTGEWNLPRLKSLLSATVSGQGSVKAYEIDFAQKGHDPRRLVVKAQKLDYAGGNIVRLLMTVSDVTDAKLAEKMNSDLLREKAVLMQELQHRVANSLQIIASVLMQSARKVQSEETRTHLNDARNRVMSIATVQRHLSQSHIGDVQLAPYFTQLCESLGASMIRDHKHQSIHVRVDDSTVSADESTSLGLIVTELVINALKHAFPDERPGEIVVEYHSEGQAWSLSVTDDGVGMSSGVKSPKAGLGTSIVEALAGQLHAKVTAHRRDPGTSIMIVHPAISAANTDEIGPTERAV